MTRHLVDRFCTIDRRTLLRGLGASGTLALGSAALSTGVAATPVFRHYPFTLGIASGDPSPSGVVLWTRLAPEPFAGGGMPMKAVEVGWEIAADERMTRTIAKGTALARPELGHAVHVEAEGLEPARDYFYRFTAGAERSPIGRTRTLPAAGGPLAELRFAVAGCQRYEDGFFGAFRQIAEDRPDFLFHYGDYIYEYRHVVPAERATFARAMPEPFDEIYTLVDYRNRYAAYKSDPDLQAAHAATPFIVSYDDHEVDNNYAGDVSEEAGIDPVLFRLRRAAAYQAWYEHMPVRRAQIPQGPDILAYRRLDFGDLLALNVLDTRQYRSDQACGDGWKVCPEAREPTRTMLGDRQEAWLGASLGRDHRRWTVLGQQVMMMQLDRNPDPAVVEASMDKWDSAPAARDRLARQIREAGIQNLVALTGDIHNAWAGQLKTNFDDPSSPAWGVEFIATSVTSGGDGSESRADMPGLLSNNPHVKYFNNRRGYNRHIVRPDRWTAEFVAFDRVSTPGAPARIARSLVVEAGKAELATA